MDRFAQIIAIATGLCLGASHVGAEAARLDAGPAGAELTDIQPVSRPVRNTGAMGLSLYFENDGAFARPNGSTDRHYTSGTGIAVQWQSPVTDEMVGAIPSIGDEFAPERPGISFGAGVVLSLNMYTPEDISDPEAIYNDRPYAGWTYVGLIAQRANRAGSIPVFEHIELDVGAVGATGQAGKVQRWVHEHYGSQIPEGWDYQIRDEVGFDYRYQRRWRIDLMSESARHGGAVQLIPEAGVTLGTVHLNAGAGALLRAGWNLPDDFGPGSMRFASDFTRSFANGGPRIGGYVFIHPSGAVVGHDSTIDGSFFQSSPVEGASQTLTGALQMGLAIQFLGHFEVSYSQTYLTHEFVGQKTKDGYGALNLTAIYTW